RGEDLIIKYGRRVRGLLFQAGQEGGVDVGGAGVAVRAVVGEVMGAGADGLEGRARNIGLARGGADGSAKVGDFREYSVGCVKRKDVLLDEIAVLVIFVRLQVAQLGDLVE